MFYLISFNSGTSYFPFPALFLSFPANSSVLQPHDKHLQWAKRGKRKETGKFKRYVDEGEGKGDRIKAGQTEHF